MISLHVLSDPGARNAPPSPLRYERLFSWAEDRASALELDAFVVQFSGLRLGIHRSRENEVGYHHLEEATATFSVPVVWDLKNGEWRVWVTECADWDERIQSGNDGTVLYFYISHFADSFVAADRSLVASRILQAPPFLWSVEAPARYDPDARRFRSYDPALAGEIFVSGNGFRCWIGIEAYDADFEDPLLTFAVNSGVVGAGVLRHSDWGASVDAELAADLAAMPADDTTSSRVAPISRFKPTAGIRREAESWEVEESSLFHEWEERVEAAENRLNYHHHHHTWREPIYDEYGEFDDYMDEERDWDDSNSPSVSSSTSPSQQQDNFSVATDASRASRWSELLAGEGSLAAAGRQPAFVYTADTS